VLFGYPVTATEDNWLHDCLCEILESIHASLKAAQTPLGWPDVIPLLYRDRLKTRTGLKDKLNTYTRALGKLNLPKQEQVLKALTDQNKISLLLSCACECESIDDLPVQIRKPATELFSFAFELLTPLGIRDPHYEKIYKAMPAHVCPFCGCEFFDAPGKPREELDHYLAKSKYSFVSVNLRNLVPMGNKCNTKHKLAKDILKKDDGTRRKSFDPLSMSLASSEPFAGLDGQLPRWQIEFIPDTEEVTTWDEVFHIRERYIGNVLDPSFKGWLENFRSWCKSANIVPVSVQELTDAIDRYATYYESMGFGEGAFLKAAVFRMLHVHCQQGNKRVVELMEDTVIGVKAAK
jgi:hypothetical protein